MPRKSPDLLGQVYGRLTVIGVVIPQIKYRKWVCQCSCGNTSEVVTASLKNGDTTSCGCFHKEVIHKHGFSRERLNGIWHGMIARCYKPTNSNYKKYGALGVTVCDEWREDYLVFREWALSHGYTDELTLDRIDCIPHYSPSTCRWATMTIQLRNQKIRVGGSCEYVGVSHRYNYNSYEASITVCKKNVYLGSYKTALEAAQARDSYIKTNKLKGFTLNF